jgi:hypothetical protein
MAQPRNEHHRILWQLLVAASHLPAPSLLPWILSLRQHACDQVGEIDMDCNEEFEAFTRFLDGAKLLS